jgi:hypothetical protein
MLSLTSLPAFNLFLAVKSQQEAANIHYVLASRSLRNAFDSSETNTILSVKLLY